MKMSDFYQQLHDQREAARELHIFAVRLTRLEGSPSLDEVKQLRHLAEWIEDRVQLAKKLENEADYKEDKMLVDELIALLKSKGVWADRETLVVHMTDFIKFWQFATKSFPAYIGEMQ